MNLNELPFPIRLYWDLTPARDASIDHRAICRQIVELKFFTLNLLYTGSPQLSSPCIEILEKLKNEMLTVSLTVSPAALNPITIKCLAELKVNELLVEASGDDDFRFVAECSTHYKYKNLTIGASFPVIEVNFKKIPDVVSFCLKNDITRLVFPMQRLTKAGDCFYVNREDGKALSNRLGAINFENMNITIHDPFLWRIFYPAVSFPGGGCQAAHSMAYISPDGNVSPCPSMPITLGSLKESTLKTILSSAAKKELVKSLREPPEECLDCEELSGCMGGCSGRVYVLSGTLSQRDPACK